MRSDRAKIPAVLTMLGCVFFLYQTSQLNDAVADIRDQLVSNSRTTEAPKDLTRQEETSVKDQAVEFKPRKHVSSYYLEEVESAGETKQMDKDELNDLKFKLSLMFWPALTGYDNRFVMPQRNGIDRQLFDRIVLHQHVYPQPLFKLKKDGVTVPRHEWQFEKIIHQTWVDEQIPGRTAPWVKKWLQLNPDWTYMFWSDKAASDFIKDHYPSLRDAYESWSVPVQRADMFRYVVLYAFGGVYADMDMEVLKNLDEVRNWSSCILSKEPDLQTFIMTNSLNSWGNNWTFTCNAFMACRSHHPFMHYVISRTVHWSPYILKRPCALEATIICTGPAMLSYAYTFYRRSVPAELRRKYKQIDVICPDYEWFVPTFDESRTELVRRNCVSRKLNQRQKVICKKYMENGSKNEPKYFSFTTHHWFHSYHQNVNKDRVDIRTLTKVLQWTTVTQDSDFEIIYPVA